MKNTTKTVFKFATTGALALAILIPMGAMGASAATSGGVVFMPQDDSITLPAGVRNVLSFTDNDEIDPLVKQDTSATYFSLEGSDTKVKLGETLTTPNATHTLAIKDGKLVDSIKTNPMLEGDPVTDVINVYTQGDLANIPVEYMSGFQTITVTINAYNGSVGTVSQARNESLQVPMNSGKANFDVTSGFTLPTGVNFVNDSFKVYGGDVAHADRADSVTSEVGTVTTETIDDKVVGTFTPTKDYFGAGSAIIQGQDEDGNLYTTTLTIDVTKVELGEPPVQIPEEETPVVVPEEETPVIVPEDAPVVPETPVVTPEEVPVAPEEVPVAVTPQNVTPVVIPEVTDTKTVVDNGLTDTLAETGASSATQVGIFAGIGILLVGLIALAFGRFAPKRKRSSVADIAGNDDTETTFHTVTKPEKDIDAPQYD